MQRGAAVQGVKAHAPATPSSKVKLLNSETSMPDTPCPDYDHELDATDNRRNSFKFVNNFKNVITHIRTIEDLYTNFPEPDPDYLNDDEEDKAFHPPDQASDFPPPPPPCTAEELSQAVSDAYDAQVHNGISPTADSLAGQAEPPLIRPKPLHNPCIESRERQALHRELLLNYKIGKDVLKKPELDKVLRDRRENQRKKEWDDQKSSKGRTSLELKLEERATKLKSEEDKKMKDIEEEAAAPELLRIHRKITLKSGSTSEQS